ncbi:MAG: SLC13 family permease [bacterium]|nr:SLC13 family permease [bacterium]
MTVEITIVLAILGVTIVLLALDVLRMDVVAILCMLALGWTGILKSLESLSGFSSNAVIAMMAVMVMGRGMEKTGIVDRFSRAILNVTGNSSLKITGLVSAAVGLMSSVIQNVGAAALFLPAVLSISRREKIPASKLIMPIGFAAILGGTLTMVGSGPLILINDFLGNAGLEPYGLFAVTPVGLVLLAAGIAFFLFIGKYVLPDSPSTDDRISAQKGLIEAWNLPFSTWHYKIPEGSTMVGKTPEETGIWDRYHLNILGISKGKTVEYAPWRQTRFEVHHELALLGEEGNVRQFAADFGLSYMEPLGKFEKLNDPDSAGFAEVIIPPRSSLVGETIRKFGLRKRYAVEPVVLFHQGENIRGDFSDMPITPGDTFIVHGLWDNIIELKTDKDFVLATPVSADKRDQSKAWVATICFVLAIGLALAGFPISTAFLSGAIVMVLTRVLRMEDAYQVIDWKVVFFLAGLIPMGIAMQKTGTAAFLADGIMGAVYGGHPLLLLFAVAGISTVFSLFMSNVASTVILAPLVISMARIAGIDPRPLVLLVAVCAANSFILPTHQVNAMLKTPGGYRNADYLKAGGGMTLIFLAVVVPMFYFFYL